jgi:hypothetical protein
MGRQLSQLFLKVALIENLFEEKTNHLFLSIPVMKMLEKKRSWVYCFDTTDTQGQQQQQHIYVAVCV